MATPQAPEITLRSLFIFNFVYANLFLCGFCGHNNKRVLGHYNAVKIFIFNFVYFVRGGCVLGYFLPPGRRSVPQASPGFGWPFGC